MTSKPATFRGSSIKININLNNDSTVNVMGLAAAAAIQIFAMPAISRLYLPNDYGSFGILFAIIATASSVATGKYEAAIVLPESSRAALGVAGAAVACSAIIAAAASLLLILGAWIIPNQVPYDLLGMYQLAVVCALLASLIQVIVNCSIRERQFKTLAISRIAGAVVQAVTAIIFGWLGWGAAGLLYSLAFGYVASLVVGVSTLRGSYQNDIRGISTSDVWNQAVTYFRFPLFSLPSTLANSIASNLPVLIFGAAYGATVTGYLTMFLRVWAGTGIITKGLGEIFRHRASNELRDTGAFRASYIQTALPLSAMALLAFLALVAVAPFAFGLVFGSQWSEAGEYGRILAATLCVQMLASPMSWSFYISERLRLLMAWQVALLIVQLVVLLGTTSIGGPRWALAAFSVSGTIMYVIYLCASFWVSKGNARDAGINRTVR